MDRFNKVELTDDEVKRISEHLTETILNLNKSFSTRKVTSGKSPQEIAELISNKPLPENGGKALDIIKNISQILTDHSLFNGHPKFLGYITSSPTPIGVWSDLLASAINANVGANILSPVATAVERQTVKWLAEFIGVSNDYGGVLVSGGNMANLTGFLAGRTAQCGDALKKEGLQSLKPQTIYCSKTTHTWVEKACILFGHGQNSLRWIDTLPNNQMDLKKLNDSIEKDIAEGKQPMMVIGTAGDVSTGVVDDLAGISEICKKYDLWFHVDGAYGVPAAVVPEYKQIFNGLEEADSIALDPHKWLYAPLEAGCTLVKNPHHLINTFSSHPEYYNFSNDENSVNFFEYGMQNSRGFRALKVWTALELLGKAGYQQLIREDIELSKLMYKLAVDHPKLEARSQNLSITTLRYVPEKYLGNEDKYQSELNELNQTLLNNMQKNGEAFFSNAVINGNYYLRGCIVNFRTTEKDIHEMIEIIVKEGDKLA